MAAMTIVSPFADEPSVARDRRRRVDTADALLIHALAGLGIGDGQHAHVAGHVDEAVVIDQRRDVRRAGCNFPGDVPGVHHAFAARLDRHVRAASIAPAQIDDAIVKDGRRNRKAVGFLEVPEPLAGRDIVPAHACARVHDDFGFAAAFDYERCAVGRHAGRGVGFPLHATRLRVERQQHDARAGGSRRG